VLELGMQKTVVDDQLAPSVDRAFVVDLNAVGDSLVRRIHSGVVDIDCTDFLLFGGVEFHHGDFHCLSYGHVARSLMTCVAVAAVVVVAGDTSELVFVVAEHIEAVAAASVAVVVAAAAVVATYNVVVVGCTAAVAAGKVAVED